MTMNVPLGLAPTRSLLQLGLGLGLRGFCARPVPIAASAARLFISTTCIAPGRTNVNATLVDAVLRRPNCSNISRFSRPARLSYSTRQLPVLDRYEDLPEDYADKEGLPFRKYDLSDSEVKKIFGQRTKTSNANRLLRILHGRRVAGTLSDPTFNVNTTQFTKHEKDKALEYLRKLVPVDEVLNAGLRAEDELRELEREAQGEVDGAPKAAETSSVPPPRRDSVYGESAFDRIRTQNIAKREEQERLEALEREERERANPGPLAKLSDQPRVLSPRMQKWSDAATSEMKEPPKMSHFERLMPGTTLVLLFVAAVAGFASLYTPPSDRDRLFPEVSAAAATVGTLIAINLTIFALWRLPPMWRVMNRYFVMVHGLPRAPSIILSNFSHSEFLHLLPNMIGLYLFGTLLHEEIGRANFLAIYLSSGALGALGSLWFLTLRGLLTYSTIGASGAVYGIMGAYFWLNRYETFKVLGFPPEPLSGPQGLGFLGLVVGLHIWGVLRPGKMTMDLTSHMVGMAAGILGVHLLERRQQAGLGPSERQDGLHKGVDIVKDATTIHTSSGPKGP